MKNFFKGFVLLMALVVITACGSSDNEDSSNKAESPDKFLRIATGPMGSGWYPITTIMAEVYMDNFKDLNVSENEGGSVPNLKALEIDDAQLGITYTSDFIDSLEGKSEFDEPLEMPNAMGSLYPVFQTIATLESNNDINSIEDIVDKHIFLGPKDSGGVVGFWRLMEMYDIDEQTIKDAGGKFSYGNYSDGASMMKDGIVDVYLAGGAPMVPALQEIDVTNPVKVIPVEEDKLEELREKDYGISTGELPADTYENQTEAIPTYTMITTTVVRADLDEEYVYNLTKFFWENLDKIESQVPTRAADITLDTALEGLSEEHLHPGALKYYKEKGVLEE